MYLILAKQSVLAIGKMLSMQIITSRSFGSYQNERSLLRESGKMFAVLVSSGESPMSVFVTEIVAGRLPSTSKLLIGAKSDLLVIS